MHREKSTGAGDASSLTGQDEHSDLEQKRKEGEREEQIKKKGTI